MYDLSILVPGIHNDKWFDLYNSVNQSCTKKTWEIIFVGPYQLPIELQDKKNVQYFQDFGPPTRCRQIGLINATGKWIFYGSDDLTFLANSIDKAFDKLNTVGIKDNTVLLGKYTEGKRDNPEMLSDDYYTFQYHDSTRQIQQMISYKAWIIMAGLVPSALLKEIGGWDCQFNVCAVACLDLSLRLQNYGIDLVIHDKPFFHASHLQGNAGDHGPIAQSQLQYDMPLLHYIYNVQQEYKRIYVHLDNWKASPNIWSLRFNDN